MYIQHRATSYSPLPAARAFRRFARLGLDRRHLDVFEAYQVISGVTSCRAAALDMLAAYDTLRLLSASGQQETVRAVRTVYFGCARQRPRKNDVTYRVLRLAHELHCDERTVYRRLEAARQLYTTLRDSYQSGSM